MTPTKVAPGRVSLIGAGPGDPSLLTRKAAARLRAAELVLYDALVDERILALARRAQRFYVGKRAGRHSLSQEEIHGVMIRAARRGRRVVRLKGGDPFVFGRGGEEALALQAAGIPFEVVPGVTSAVAAPVLGGIPLTHRGVAAAFLTISGHDVDAFARTVEHLPPHGLTIVVLMGVANRARIANALLTRGWFATTPAAIVADASLEAQQVWRGTLGALAAGESMANQEGPAVIVIGAVAGMDLTTNDAAAHNAQVAVAAYDDVAACGTERRIPRG